MNSSCWREYVQPASAGDAAADQATDPIGEPTDSDPDDPDPIDADPEETKPIGDDAVTDQSTDPQA